MTVRENRERKEKLSKTSASGTVALIFLILGFQLAVFVMKVVRKPAPETAAEQASEMAAGQASQQVQARPMESADSGGYSTDPGCRSQPGRTARSGGQARSGTQTQQRNSLGGYDAPEPQYRPRPPRKVESFPFDPNTVSLEDLVRLGLSERQAESIENYRSKGGSFQYRTDFKKMYVVSDSLYERLEPFIDIPKVELNTADSSALVSLRGIGPFYARKIIEYREQLGGYYSPEQLLEVYGMDEERFAPLRGCVKADGSLIRPLDLWALPEDSLARHPYVGRSTARSVTRYKKVCDTASWTLDGLAAENVLDSTSLARLRHYVRNF